MSQKSMLCASRQLCTHIDPSLVGCVWTLQIVFAKVTMNPALSCHVFISHSTAKDVSSVAFGNTWSILRWSWCNGTSRRMLLALCCVSIDSNWFSIAKKHGSLSFLCPICHIVGKIVIVRSNHCFFFKGCVIQVLFDQLCANQHACCAAADERDKPKMCNLWNCAVQSPSANLHPEEVKSKSLFSKEGRFWTSTSFVHAICTKMFKPTHLLEGWCFSKKPC